MKSKLLILSLLFCLNSFGQKLPITGLCWSDVFTATGTSCSPDAWAAANSGYFDATYAVSGNCLDDWRNYGPSACAELATIATVSMATYFGTTATATVNMSSQGTNCTVTEMGMCYGASANPSTAGPHTSTTVTTGNHSFYVTGLTAGATYHYRAYATNSYGTAYGADETFTMSSCSRETSGCPDTKLFTVYNGVAINSSTWCNEYTYQSGTREYIETEACESSGIITYWLGYGSTTCDYVPDGYYLYEFYGTLLRYHIINGVVYEFCPQ